MDLNKNRDSSLVSLSDLLVKETAELLRSCRSEEDLRIGFERILHSSAGRGFGTPSVMEHVGLPKFNPKNKTHLKLSQASQECHKLKIEGKVAEISKIENEINDLVKKLFGI